MIIANNFYITYDSLGNIEESIQSNDIPENAIQISKEIRNYVKQKYRVNLSTKELELNPSWPPSGFIEDPPDSGNLVEMNPQEKINAGLETIDKYRDPVIQSIVDEMNEREKPLLAPYSKGQQLSFSTRKKEAIGWLSLLSADKTITTAQTDYSMLYRIVTIENGIVNPIADDITNAANSIIEKVNLFEQTLTALSSKKDALIGRPEVLDANNIVVQPASGIYSLTVDELINYGDVKTKWDSI